MAHFKENQLQQTVASTEVPVGSPEEKGCPDAGPFIPHGFSVEPPVDCGHPSKTTDTERQNFPLNIKNCER